MTATKRTGRGAFTTIELLVVVAVIAVLVALTTGAIQRVRIAAKRAETAQEAGQLGAAVGSFTRDKRVDYIPSTIVLRERMDYDSNNAIEVASATYLKQVWPQIPLALSPGGTQSPFAPGAGINWNNANGIETGAVTLEGDQCLVFFLGGIPLPQANGTFGVDGFGKNPVDPSAAPRGGSTFEFKSARLRARTNPAGARGFPSFFDPYYSEPYPVSKPYAYFSAHGRKNNALANGGFGYLPRSSTFHDCGTLTGTGFVPYRDTGSTYYLPTGFQIISAGIDQNFGGGGLAPSAATALGQPDADNVTNFSNGQLSNIGN